jgi:hypothetical protein
MSCYISESSELVLREVSNATTLHTINMAKGIMIQRVTGRNHKPTIHSDMPNIVLPPLFCILAKKLLHSLDFDTDSSWRKISFNQLSKRGAINLNPRNY